MAFDYTFILNHDNTECLYIVLNELVKKYNVLKKKEFHTLATKLIILQEYLIQDLGVSYVSYDQNGYNFKIVNNKQFVLARLKYGI